MFRLLRAGGRASCLALLLCLVSACASAPVGSPQDRLDQEQRVRATLDALHAAAASADGAAYFALFDDAAVYYGTDAGERWSVAEFRAFAEPYFSRGRGWTYTATERHVFLSQAGDTAWFDERLWNESYGETRGSGVLVRAPGADSPWRFVQYNLTIPVPNELAVDLVERIRALPAAR